MASWGLLDERSESELHKSRLLNVEEKPFKRITKRLAAISAAVNQIAQTDDAKNGDDTITSPSISAMQEDLTLDFAAFDSSIARLQFLYDANNRERLRYDADNQRILDECQAVRDKNTQLREQLEDARGTLAQRKKFDELAEKITSNRLLRPRDDQLISLTKLEEECRELERESETYSATWKERRDQFNRIMEEGMLLRRQIRDEKEEVDRREGMNEGAEDDGDGDRPAATPRGEQSGHPTPRPDDDDGDNDNPEDAKGTVDGETPLPSTGGRTPAGGDHLQVPETQRHRGTVRNKTLSGNNTPIVKQNKEEAEELDKEDDEGDDVDMDAPTIPLLEEEDAATPQPGGEKMEVDE